MIGLEYKQNKMFLSNHYFKLCIRVYELKKSKQWMYFNKKYEIVGIGKTTFQARKNFIKHLNKKLKTNVKR